MNGKMKKVMIRPPIKNPITAISDGNCSALSPVIACPEVQPPAYLEPKPIRSPPTTRYAIPPIELRASNPKISVGKKAEPAFSIPKDAKDATVLGLNAIAVLEVK